MLSLQPSALSCRDRCAPSSSSVRAEPDGSASGHTEGSSAVQREAARRQGRGIGDTRTQSRRTKGASGDVSHAWLRSRPTAIFEHREGALHSAIQPHTTRYVSHIRLRKQAGQCTSTRRLRTSVRTRQSALRRAPRRVHRSRLPAAFLRCLAYPRPSPADSRRGNSGAGVPLTAARASRVPRPQSPAWAAAVRACPAQQSNRRSAHTARTTERGESER